MVGDGTLQLDDIRVQRKFILIDAVQVSGRHSAEVRFLYYLCQSRKLVMHLPANDGAYQSNILHCHVLVPVVRGLTVL